jgi:hypothetical protein
VRVTAMGEFLAIVMCDLGRADSCCKWLRQGS